MKRSEKNNKECIEFNLNNVFKFTRKCLIYSSKRLNILIQNVTKGNEHAEVIYAATRPIDS